VARWASSVEGSRASPHAERRGPAGSRKRPEAPHRHPTSPKPLSRQGVDWWVRLSPMVLGDMDDNLGTGTRYPSGIRPDGYGYGNDFLPAGGTRTRPKSRRVRDGYFFSPVGNPTGIRYFTTDIILGCEQVKMCSFYYINYDLF
jgi:hypothetical protein